MLTVVMLSVITACLVMLSFVILTEKILCQNAGYLSHYASVVNLIDKILSVIMLSAVILIDKILSVILLSVVILTVKMLSVIMLSVPILAIKILSVIFSVL
jgi:hypothetical protein